MHAGEQILAVKAGLKRIRHIQGDERHLLARIRIRIIRVSLRRLISQAGHCLVLTFRLTGQGGSGESLWLLLIFFFFFWWGMEGGGGLSYFVESPFSFICLLCCSCSFALFCKHFLAIFFCGFFFSCYLILLLLYVCLVLSVLLFLI